MDYPTTIIQRFYDIEKNTTFNKNYIQKIGILKNKSIMYAIRLDTNFLCDLWMALSQFSKHENMSYKEYTTLVDIMNLVKKVLILKFKMTC
ncbi:hypothetical protein GCM10023262_15640 [Bartonella pachyuromydis]|uniref:Uncharacterized protein n=1 Tax=Bartonella pachyuromydis TaxID=931097 RepID=A0ABP8VLX9_9HYPH